jgi:CcmE
MRIKVLFYLVPVLGCHIGCLKTQSRYPVGSFSVSPVITEETQTPGPKNTLMPPSPQRFFTTIAEIVKRPGFFDGQKVRLTGKVTNLQLVGSRRGKSISSFDLADSEGNKVRVNLEKPSTLKVGQQVSVEGLLTTPSNPAAHTAVILTGSRLVSKTGRPVPAKPKIRPPQGKSPPPPPQPFSSPPVESPEQVEGEVF